MRRLSCSKTTMGLGTGPVRLAQAGGQMEIIPPAAPAVGINGDVIVSGNDFRNHVRLRAVAFGWRC